MSAAILLAVWRTNRLLPVLLAVLLLANVGLYVWTEHRLSPGLTALERRYSEMRAQVRLSQPESAISLHETLRQAEIDLQTFRQAIPAEGEFTGLIGELFTMAASAGLTLDRVGYTPKLVEERGLLRYDLVFSVRGDYRQVKKFVHSIEQSARIITIEGLSLAGQESAAEGAVNLSIRLSTYFATAPS